MHKPMLLVAYLIQYEHLVKLTKRSKNENKGIRKHDGDNDDDDGGGGGGGEFRGRIW